MEMGVCDVLSTSYWDVGKALEREKAATRAFKDFNKEYLNIKLQALEAPRDRLVNGAKHIVHNYIKGGTYLGCAPIDFSQQFLDQDLEFLSNIYTTGGEDEPIMDDEMLDYGGDHDDEPPLEGLALEIYNLCNNPSAPKKWKRSGDNPSTPKKKKRSGDNPSTPKKKNRSGEPTRE